MFVISGTVLFMFVDSNEAETDKIVRTKSIEKIRSLSKLKLSEQSNNVHEDKKESKYLLN